LMSAHHQTKRPLVLLGVDGGGTRCRARLADAAGKTLGESVAGPANPRHGMQETLWAVRKATDQCLRQAELGFGNCRIVACLALAGVGESKNHTQVQASRLAFHRLILTSDARAACLGAHGGLDGGIIIVGTGSVGWAIAGRQEHRVGGWGFPVSDEGSGAFLGCEALRRVLWAHDGLIPWTGLLRALFERFGRESYGIVHWMGDARPRDFASLAPTIVEHARQGDAMACELMQSAAAYIETVAARLRTLGVTRLSLMGGLANSILPFLSHQTRSGLVAAKGDALDGALQLACAEAGGVERMESASNA
jgi:glucosamine kinase